MTICGSDHLTWLIKLSWKK
uniref:Uncharacterized protein n=1 Tax=Anguilla anguilla TaxID=7936 RepID=A0A0E9R4G3_ANGAN